MNPTSQSGQKSKPAADTPNTMTTGRDPKECSLHRVTKTIVTSPAIYKPVGPYSQAVLAENTLYVSAILGMNTKGQIVCGGAEVQTRQLLNNLKHVLEAGGASLESVVQTTIRLAYIEDFKIVNKIYSEFYLTFAGYLNRLCGRPLGHFWCRVWRPLVSELVKPPPWDGPKATDMTWLDDCYYTTPDTDNSTQAILADKTLYVSGILGLNPEGQMVSGGAEAETRQILDNLKHVLAAGGASLESVVKSTILLRDIQDFKAVNQVYAEYFARDFPVRATFQVGKLPLNAAVEIDAVALSGDLVVSEAGPCPCHQN